MQLMHLEVDLTGRSDALARVVLLLGGRRCEIVSLEYLRSEDGEAARVLLDVRVPPRRPLAAWLEGLIDVLAVREGTTAPAQRSHG
ncbi:MAG: hypothetical protein JWQ20_1744 [Conexibacter sp.]|nr:hypothetical protein [Conexibacter sp.]